MAEAHDRLVAQNKAHTLTSWTAQQDWNPISIMHGSGVYFWDADGRKYLDWSSQLFNLNLGHGHPAVLEVLASQSADLQYAMPGLASEPRARLGALLGQITPTGLNKAFFTTGGADANENAIKMARLFTGRQKILSRYRSYHGATFGAMSAGGDPRRLANEPGVPWIIRMPDPYAYRSPLYRERSREAGDQALVDSIEEIILLEGPENIAAILLEGYSGTSGIVQGGEVYWQGIQALKEKYGLLLIVDEVLSGFGRTGRWFGIDHYPWVRPDLLTMAKGLTSGYLPLGAVMMTDEIAAHFDSNPFHGGLTYSSHPLCCLVGEAVVRAYQEENLVEHAESMGRVLRAGLVDLAEKFEVIGDVRGAGLHYVIELVRDRGTKEPLGDFNRPLSGPMRTAAAALRHGGMSTFVKWNWIFSAPPIIVSKAQIAEGLAILEEALGQIETQR